MKKILLIIITISIVSCAPLSLVQIDPTVENIEVKGNIYVSANNWLVESFDSAKSMIQFRDKEEGIITGRYLLKTLGEYSQYGDTRNHVYAIIKVQVKDNAARITIDPEDYKTNISKFSKEQYVFDKKQALTEINEFTASFEYYMKNHIDDF